MNETPYVLYVRSYGMIRSGATLSPKDYGFPTGSGLRFHGEQEAVAISLAAQDVSLNEPLRSRAALEAELRELLG